jgi:hypothetical protein
MGGFVLNSDLVERFSLVRQVGIDEMDYIILRKIINICRKTDIKITSIT